MIVLLTALASAVFCGVYLALARRRNIVATPNERSSHATPTPHGGGLPMLAAFFAALALSALSGTAWDTALWLLAVAAALLLAVGVIDDLRGLSVRLRLAVYAATCCALALYLLWPRLAEQSLLAWSLLTVATLGLLWLLNLYNFMDGIDGIAGLQAMLACAAAALLARGGDDASHYMLFCLLLAAAHAGFLFWNRPPARLFMGDAGSVPTGFLLGGLALLGYVQGQISPLCWLILLALFITDASWTLLWRVLTRQAFTQAHRSHAYQRLSRHWRSHGKVDALFVAIFLLWLFPLAWASVNWPQFGVFLVILAYLPLLAGMAMAWRIQ
ncbi:MAG: glycosyl transferase [Halioglobus sp.]|nr:glycosyl transferase [Halioglobus sp.]